MQKQFMRTIDTTIELLAGVGDNNIGVIMESFYFQQCRTPPPPSRGAISVDHGGGPGQRGRLLAVI